MINYILIADQAHERLPAHPERRIMGAMQWVDEVEPPEDVSHGPNLRILNLCSSYDYLSKGYFVALLAEARGQRSLPSVSDIVKLALDENYDWALPELNQLLQKHWRPAPGTPEELSLDAYFGRCEDPSLSPLARRIFDLFRFPLLQFDLTLEDDWRVAAIRPLSLPQIAPSKLSLFQAALTRFTGTPWTRSNEPSRTKDWIAILQNPGELRPPSNAQALTRLCDLADEFDFEVELITQENYAYLHEYDALFIRETTAVNHHTFRFALKAAREGMVVIDDPQSIVRCSNKVFLNDLARCAAVPIPRTWLLDHRNAVQLARSLPYPLVLKLPDGSFSLGVIRVECETEFLATADSLLRHSEIILVQEFVPSNFDWRIGVLDGAPIFACQYFMAKDHWQVVNYAAGAKELEGQHLTVPLEDVPSDVLALAVRVSQLTGQGLYGVDIKESDRGPLVLEVNDNPNIDAGIEDAVRGDDLYRDILAHFRRRVDGAGNS